MNLLYVRECVHGKTLSTIAVPAYSWFSDPACTYKNGSQRNHHADPADYREATEDDYYNRPVKRRQRSDKGKPRGPRK